MKQPNAWPRGGRKHRNNKVQTLCIVLTYNQAVVLSNYAKHVKGYICAYLGYVQH